MNATLDSQKDARILIIDDEEASALGLSRIIEKAGYAVCITITDPQIAIDRLADIAPDLVLLDLHMEPLSGVEVLADINTRFDAHKRPPVIVLTADTTSEARHDALNAGAVDFLAKPLDHQEVLLRIKNVLHMRALFQRCQNYSQGLERIVQERTEELQRRTRDLEATLVDLRATQCQIIQQERIRALGAMASGIAHDMNNSLTLILGYGDMLLKDTERFPAGCKHRAELNQVMRAARDSSHMIARLREIYRPRSQGTELSPIDLNELIVEVVALTAPKWQAQAEAGGANIKIEHAAGDIPQVAGAPAELREVLTNLIFNAVDAMPKGGTICLRTRETKGFARVEVCDTGTGMTEDACHRCLEPFFTTKGDKGTGLGLAVSAGIIRRHGGEISIESRVNCGTTFRIDLPICNGESIPPQKPVETPAESLRVLVVDDQKGICEVVRSYLAEDHHIVEIALNSPDALKKYRRSQFDLVITDRAMPGINGDELTAAIRQINPQQHIIMLTGFSDLMAALGEKSENVDLVIGKPICLEDLRHAICDVMSSYQLVM